MQTVLVIIPVYNASPYVGECLRSLFAQSFQDFFVVCVDDGSTDDSLNKLESFGLTHQNLSIIRTGNYGPSHARNTALDTYLTRGFPLIMFLDADDMLEPDYLQIMVNAQTASNAEIVCSSFQFLKQGRKSPFRLMGTETRLLSGFDAAEELLADRTIQSHGPCKLYKASLWEGVRFPEYIVAMEDQGTVFKTFYRANHVLINPSINGYLYRQTGNSVCSSPMTNKRVLDSIEGYTIPCKYDYPDLDLGKKRRLISSAKQSLAACYLMVYPRFAKKKATADEMARWTRLKDYVTKEKIVQKFRPSDKKEMAKRICYLWFRPFYSMIYKAFQK